MITDRPDQSPSPPPTNPLKRKDNPADEDPPPPLSDRAPDEPSSLPTTTIEHHQDDDAEAEGEYEQGRVLCQSCGSSISFRDDDTKEFTMKHWNAHRQSCPSSGPAGSSEPVLYTPEIGGGAGVQGLSHHQHHQHPPAKRRRAKRTEDERIEYLRVDPYVAKFEAYRVLCRSCDKWIRLRPNSTYCSIPWDAHRKSCLAKKINNKNVYALEERNSLFSKDPDVRKFDPERLLCNICDKWIPVPSDDHLQAVQKWLQHRANCTKAHAPSSSGTRPDPSSSLSIPAPSVSTPAGPSQPSQQPTTSPSAPIHGPSTSTTAPPDSPSASTSAANPPPGLVPARFRPASRSPLPAFLDLNPANYAPAHESRRRNAEQRAATLRADGLIGQVEPNRVFCSLCQKWVQLRQDSSYCAYPWIQHRGKCLARHQRRAQKLAEIEQVRAAGGRAGIHGEEDQLMSGDENALGDGTGPPSDDFESEDGADSPPPPPPPAPSRAGPSTEHQQDRTRSALTGKAPSGRRSEVGAPGGSRLRNEHGHGHGHSASHRAPGIEVDRYYAPPPPAAGSASSSSKHGSHTAHHSQRHQQHHKSRSVPFYSSAGPSSRGAGGSGGGGGASGSGSTSYRHVSRHSLGGAGGGGSSRAGSRHWATAAASSGAMDDDADADGDDVDADGDEMDDDPPLASSTTRYVTKGPFRRTLPATLADLDSESGRRQFVFASVEYLFATTYEPTDEMSISALLTYLNAAMPPDKHEDYDTGEVARAVGAMKDKGRIIFEGDTIRLID